MQKLPVSAAMTENLFFKSMRKQSCSLHSRNTSAGSPESPDVQNRGEPYLLPFEKRLFCHHHAFFAAPLQNFMIQAYYKQLEFSRQNAKNFIY